MVTGSPECEPPMTIRPARIYDQINRINRSIAIRCVSDFGSGLYQNLRASVTGVLRRGLSPALAECLIVKLVGAMNIGARLLLEAGSKPSATERSQSKRFAIKRSLMSPRTA
jgi:hypothetical protein